MRTNSMLRYREESRVNGIKIGKKLTLQNGGKIKDSRTIAGRTGNDGMSVCVEWIL
jgi:hypothetical protein